MQNTYAHAPLRRCSPASLPAVREQCLRLLNRGADSHRVREIHARMLRFGLLHEDAFLSARLLDAACSALDLSYASALFPHLPSPNSFARNALLRAYASSFDAKTEAILLYDRLLRDGVVPDKYAFTFVLKACAFLLAASEGMQIHGQILKLGFSDDVYANNSLLHMYVSCGLMLYARKVFAEMPETTVVSWNTVMEGFVQSGESEEALDLFRMMQLDGGGGLIPDKYSMQSAVSASAGLGTLALGMWAHCFSIRTAVEIGVLMQNALIDMYSRCGCVALAYQVFDRMPERNVSTFNAMIFGLAMHGHWKEAVGVFSAMEDHGVKPNSITFVGVLSACSHCGMIEDGRKYFRSMTSVYGIEPQMEHYGCMVDLLTKAGCVEEAGTLISRMPVDPDAAIWRSMLTAFCWKINGGVEFSEFAAQKILESGNDSGGVFVLLSKAYALMNRWNDVGAVRKMMTGKGIRKQPGCSSIEIDGIVHEFLSGDTSHPQSEEIYDAIDSIDNKLRSIGYIPDRTQAIMVDEHDPVKEDPLKVHSERLAIAFGLLSRRKHDEDAPIRIMKNLRTCRDCHHVAKLISDVFNVEIIMRDRVRFHHFKKGSCSCMDYW